MRLLAQSSSGKKTHPKAGIVPSEQNIKHKKHDAVPINFLMNKLTLLISLCIFSCASWSDCIGDCVNGYGTFTLSDGNKYAGQWKGGAITGQGTFTWVSGEFAGDKYVGQWKDNNKNGQGTITWANGDKYVGQFKDNNKNGQGTLTWADGRKYVGQFKDSQIIPGQGTEYLIDGTQIVFGSPTELIGANGQTLRTNVPNNELAGIRSESVENKRRADELLVKQQRQQERDSELEYQRQQEKDRQLAIQQRQNKKLIVGIQRQLIEYQYLGGIADGIAGRNTSIALERFYQDTEIIRPSLDDYTTITEDLDLNLMNADGSCSNNSVDQSKYTVCFNIAL